VEEKRKHFEMARERENQEMKQRSLARSLEMHKALEQNQVIAEERKQMLLKGQHEAEMRLTTLAVHKERMIEVKKRHIQEKATHSVEVRRVMERTLQQRVTSIQAKAHQRDESMTVTQSKREWQLMIRREQEMLKREEKSENMERITRAQDYKKNQILEKIEYDNTKT
jgi:hypothetical protein